MKTSHKGLGLIKRSEGLRLKAYLCPAGVPTIGYGVTRGVTREDVKRGRTITEAEAEQMLREELAAFEVAVLRACTAAPNQNQFDAMVSLAYNIGEAGFRSSTVLKCHNRGDFAAAARAFGLWNKATVNGKKQALTGLTRRRAAEAALYLEVLPMESPVVAMESMPQAIEPESNMTSSTINRASVVAGGTATVAAVSETVGAINGVKYGLESLGPWLVPLLLVAVVGLCGYIIWERAKQRTGGWA